VQGCAALGTASASINTAGSRRLREDAVPVVRQRASRNECVIAAQNL
jgi:hypothetical protein